MIELYTDGTGCTQSKVAAAGFVGLGVSQAWRFNGTSQQAELLAVLRALEFIASKHSDGVVYTDSRNVLGWVNEHWKTSTVPLHRLRLRAVQCLAELKGLGFQVSVQYVKGHSGVELNERIDQLCKEHLQRARKGDLDATDVLDLLSETPKSAAGPSPLFQSPPAIQAQHPTLALVFTGQAVHHLTVTEGCALRDAYCLLLEQHAFSGARLWVPESHVILVRELGAHLMDFQVMPFQV